MNGIQKVLSLFRKNPILWKWVQKKYQIDMMFQ